MISELKKRTLLLPKLLFVAILFFSFTLSAQQSTKCPRGVSNCRGLCGWFVDTDHDGYCEYSAFTIDVAAKLAARRDSIAQIKIKKEKARLDSIDRIEKAKAAAEKKQIAVADNKQTQQSPADEPATHNPEVKAPADSAIIRPQQVTPETVQAMPSKVLYDLIPVGTISLVLYLLTFFLCRIGTITKSTHRKIWNLLLLVTFLVTGLLGLFLVVQLNYNLLFDWVRKVLYWHVEFGIGMAFISIFHILWHLKYFTHLFKAAKKKD